jgi:hypothetical protein
MLSRILAEASPDQDHRESMKSLPRLHAFAVVRLGSESLPTSRENTAHPSLTWFPHTTERRQTFNREQDEQGL